MSAGDSDGSSARALSHTGLLSARRLAVRKIVVGVGHCFFEGQPFVLGRFAARQDLCGESAVSCPTHAHSIGSTSASSLVVALSWRGCPIRSVERTHSTNDTEVMNRDLK